jgi:signal peptidase I
MAPTLLGTSSENGDRILVEKITRLWRAPKRWEIHFLYNSEGTPVTKRVVGLPGERVSVRNNCVCINGAEVSPPSELQKLKYYAMGNLAAGREVDCGQGFFVMGDDSRDSWDSRYLGPVARADFRGRAWCIVSPLNRARLLN